MANSLKPAIDSGVEDSQMSGGKTYMIALHVDIKMCIDTLKYFAGWADKIHGKTMEVCLCFLVSASESNA